MPLDNAFHVAAEPSAQAYAAVMSPSVTALGRMTPIIAPTAELRRVAPPYCPAAGLPTLPIARVVARHANELLLPRARLGRGWCDRAMSVRARAHGVRRCEQRNLNPASSADGLIQHR